MTEGTINSLMHILALLLSARNVSNYIIEKNIVISFLQKQIPSRASKKYIAVFEENYKIYTTSHETSQNSRENNIQLLSKVTKQINKDLPFKQRIFLLISLIEYSQLIKQVNASEHSFDDYFTDIKAVSSALQISDAIFETCYNYAKGDYHLIAEQERILVVLDSSVNKIHHLKNFHLDNINGLFYILNLDSDFYLVRYHGNSTYFIDHKIIAYKTTYFLSLTSSIYHHTIKTIYFNEINKYFHNRLNTANVALLAENIEYKFKNSNNGVKSMSFLCESNELIGILGSSGSGKTTLLNLLSGSLQPHNGTVYINGYDITHPEIPAGIIGNIPQDDILINTLTVFENLYFNAKLCLGDLDNEQLRIKVNNLLEQLGLFEVKDLRVGTHLNTKISGGQRKRLNIALELIREPHILFVDEPTSGLSSNDSARIVHLLKQQALNQRIIFINIHQPSEELFYLFDKILLLDKGGHAVYQGRPGDAVGYFRSIVKKVEVRPEKKSKSEPEEILSIIEDTVYDEFGNHTNKRIVTPENWYKEFRNRFTTKNKNKRGKEQLPSVRAKNASPYSQFVIYLTRNILSRKADLQYLALTSSVPPLLALILSLLCKQMTVNQAGDYYYVFSENSNIASFYFMSVIVAMFIGLVVSAEEIFTDRKLISRDCFLRLNKTSYILSKVTFLAIVSAFQTMIYVVISSLILKLSGNILVYWLTLFNVALFANVLGLLISGLFYSLVAIYVMIPLLLVPQILLSGVVVKYENFHPVVTSDKYVPFIGDLMPARWAYESLIVNQFKSNDFQKNFFAIEQKESEVSYALFVQIPQLHIYLNEIAGQETVISESTKNINIIKNELLKLQRFENLDGIDRLIENIALKDSLDILNNYLKKVVHHLTVTYNNILDSKDLTVKKLQYELGGEVSYMNLKRANSNNSIRELVLNTNDLSLFKISDNELIQKTDPIYKRPLSGLGRAHFFASEKLLINKSVSTITFNTLVVTFITILLISTLLGRYFPISYKFKKNK